MKDDTILNLMVAHHSLLEALFSIVKEEAGKDSGEAKDALLEFIWELKKHFFTEEEAVFRLVPKENNQINGIIKHLMDEHIMMTEKLKDLKDLDEFYGILTHHREEEEKELYPVLDKELPEGLKREIIARINEIPLSAKA